MAGQNFLDRFRPLGAPGAATRVGGPASDDLGPAVELAPVFAALADQVETCRSLVAAAAVEVDRELARARERADAIVARARLDVGGEQASAAARVLEAAAAIDAGILDAAVKEAAEAEQAGTAQVAAVVRDVIDRLLSEQLGRT